MAGELTESVFHEVVAGVTVAVVGELVVARRRSLQGCLVESTPPLAVRWAPCPPSPPFAAGDELGAGAPPPCSSRSRNPS
jgi:hypothetical protein